MDKLTKYVIDKRKKVIFYVLFICVFVFAAVIMYKRDVTNAMQQPRSVMSAKQNMVWSYSTDEIIIREGVKLEQQITMVSSNFTGFSLAFRKKEDKKEGIVLVQLTDGNGKTIESWEVENSEIEGSVKRCFYVPQKRVNIGDVYSILVSSVFEECGIAVETIDLRNIKGENQLFHEVKTTGMKENSVIENKSLSYDIFDGACGSLKYFYFLILAGILVFISLMIVLNAKKVKKEWIFAICVLVVGSIYTLVIPPYTVPDEAAHFVTAYAESSMLMGEKAFDENGNIILQPEAAQYLTRDENPTKSRYASLIRNILGKDENVVLDEVSARKPLFMKHLGYAPQVVGTILGRVLRLNGDQLIILGRIFALIWYCIVMFWSIRVIPQFGKNVLFVVGMLPMSIQLVASYNYDSVLIGACLFLISYFLYLAYDEKKTVITVKDVVVLLIATMVIVPIKFVYLPILGLGILIPKEKFGGMKQKVFTAGLLIEGAMLSLLLTRMGTIMNAVSTVPSTGSYIEKYTVLTFVKEPVKTFVTIFLTLEKNITFFYESMLGNCLGWLEICVPNFIMYGFTVLLFFSIVLREKENHPWNDRTRFWLVLLSGSVVCILAFVFLLDMTPINSEVVLGIQGRYFLPILPLLLLAFQNKRIYVKASFDRILNSAMCVLHTATMMSVVSVIINR